MPETVQHVTATQAARLVGVNEKTIRLWVKSGQVSATHPTPNRLAIPMSEIQRIIAEREKAATLAQVPAPADLARQVAELRTELEELRRAMNSRVSELEERIAGAEGNAIEATVHATRTDKPARTTHRTSRASTQALGESSIEAIIIDTLAGAGEPRTPRQMYQNRERLRLANQNAELEPALARLVEEGKIVRAGDTVKGTPLYALPDTDDEQSDGQEEAT